MADITGAMVKELRERTGAGIADVKKALVETGGDMDKAIDFLRKKGLATAAKKEARVAAEGAVASYIHMGGKIGVLVEVNCETDFAARGDDFQHFVKEVAMQIAAMRPEYVTAEEIPAAVVDKEREIAAAKAKESGKPDAIVAKMVDGAVAKWTKEVCLLDQPYVRDDKKTIRDLQNELTAKVGEKVKVRRFVRFELGQGIEKRKDDFAAEVAKQMGT